MKTKDQKIHTYDATQVWIWEIWEELGKHGFVGFASTIDEHLGADNRQNQAHHFCHHIQSTRPYRFDQFVPKQEQYVGDDTKNRK